MNKYYFEQERLFKVVPKDKVEQLKVDIEKEDNKYIEENYLKISCPFKKAKNGYKEFVDINDVQFRQTFFKILNLDITYFENYNKEVAKYKVDQIDLEEINQLKVAKTKKPTM